MTGEEDEQHPKEMLWEGKGQRSSDTVGQKSKSLSPKVQKGGREKNQRRTMEWEVEGQGRKTFKKGSHDSGAVPRSAG